MVPARRFFNFKLFSFCKLMKSPKYLSNLHIWYENDSKCDFQISNMIGSEKSKTIDIARRDVFFYFDLFFFSKQMKNPK